MSRYTIPQLLEAVKTSQTFSDVCRKVNVTICTSNFKRIKDICSEHLISTDHFDGGVAARRIAHYPGLTYDQIFCVNSRVSRSSLRALAKRFGLYTGTCFKCNNGEMWNGEPITIELDHINGINDDNREENLRWLCPNCHSQTPTYRKSHNRKKLAFIPTHPAPNLITPPINIVNVSTDTKAPYVIDALRDCRAVDDINVCDAPRKKKSVFAETTKEEMEQLLQYNTQSQIGAKFGVTANAVRRYCKKLSIRLPRDGYVKSNAPAPIPKPPSVFKDMTKEQLAIKLITTTLSQIAIDMGCTISCVRYWCKRLGVALPGKGHLPPQYMPA